MRSVTFGAVAVPLVYVAGFVVSAFQNPLALGLVFVLVATAAMLGLKPIRDWVELHARLSVVVFAVVVVVVLPLVVLWLVQPAYIGPAR